ncbi:hypothetical protein XELAEV_18046854mg [Xenopus laevis]|uniref:Uncharacterized protein n=1 Tax=Xenopus laevis TaxID=8355 RepID=A0A974BU63_XENLA|nr:hypothetical protein XELAEV_18046854mg [Xenopus laevis]
MKTKALEAKFHEEKLCLQQKHDADVQKTLLRESQVIRETKENQISELKKTCEQSNESPKNEWERKSSTSPHYTFLLHSAQPSVGSLYQK